VSTSIQDATERLLVQLADQSRQPEDFKFSYTQEFEKLGLGLTEQQMCAVQHVLLRKQYIRSLGASSKGDEAFFALTADGLAQGIDLKPKFTRVESFRRFTDRWAGVLVLMTLIVTSLAAYFAFLATEQ
jgi:hypothetical protein